MLSMTSNDIIVLTSHVLKFLLGVVLQIFQRFMNDIITRSVGL